MSLQEGDERPRADVADALTFAFADLEAGVSGMARAGFTEEGTSGLAVLFSGSDPVAAAADTAGGDGERAWEAIGAAVLRADASHPLDLVVANAGVALARMTGICSNRARITATSRAL